MGSQQSHVTAREILREDLSRLVLQSVPTTAALREGEVCPRQVNKINIMMIKVMMMLVKISHLLCSSLNPQQRSRKKEQYLTDR